MLCVFIGGNLGFQPLELLPRVLVVALAHARMELLGLPGVLGLVLLDQLVQGVVFLLPLRLGALRHKNLKNVCQPFLNLGSFEILAESLQKAMLEL